jgi:pimeloyl-ACP methyl ester carboxylesterase
MERGYLTTADGQMHYREDGTGPSTIVLLHQALRSSLEYKRVVPYLRDRARVISVDLMGYGDSDAPPRQYDIPAHAERVHDLLRHLRVEKVCLVGHHTGGNVAIEVAAQFPEAADRLVLSGPAFVLDAAERDELVTKMSAIEYPSPVADGSHLQSIWNEGLISSFDVPRIPSTEPDLLADFFLEQIKVGPRRKEAHIAAFSHLAAPSLARLSLPILIIVGDEDMWACRRWKEMLEVQPMACLVRLPTAGEAPRLLPQRFAELIAAHLDHSG